MKVILCLLFVAIVYSAHVSMIVQKDVFNYQKGFQKEKVSVMLLFKKQADFKGPQFKKNIKNKERGVAVLEEVQRVAAETQKNVIERLKKLKLQYKSYYVQNCIIVDNATPNDIYTLADEPEIESILSNNAFRVPLEESKEKIYKSTPNEPLSIEWNVKFVKADQVWAKGIDGKGFTIANADTGVDWKHSALLPNYRGNLGSTVNHNYNWYDGVRKILNKDHKNRCGYNTTAPCDDYGHGTHCMGTSVGASSTRKIGVAPGAKWISCRNMDAGRGSPQTYIECLQFFLAPHDLSGKNPKPELRPHSIGNSYGCPRSERCEPDSLKAASKALKAAGVFMAVSAGNAGRCSTVRDPPSHYKSVFTVGASGRNTHTIASYSSKGPVTIDGSNRIKPDVTAPGSSVTSSVPNNGYRAYSGTSMASPHINGMIALLWQANKKFDRKIKKTIKIIQETCLRQQSTNCNSNGIPNNVYGYGSVDFLAAIEKIKSK